MLFRIALNIVTDSLLFRQTDPDGMGYVDDAPHSCVEYYTLKKCVKDCDGFAAFPSLGSSIRMGWKESTKRLKIV